MLPTMNIGNMGMHNYSTENGTRTRYFITSNALLKFSRPSIFDIPDKPQTPEIPLENFKRAFYESSTGMALLSPQGVWLTVNSALGQYLGTNFLSRTVLILLGYSQEEFIANTFVPMTHPEDVEKSLNLIRQMLAGEIHHFAMVKRYLHKHGHIVWCCLNTALVRDVNNVPQFFVAQINPVDVWRSLINGPDLKRDEETYCELINEAPMGICIISKEGNISTVNRYTCERLGYTSNELIGKPLLAVVSKEDQDAVRKYLSVVMNNTNTKRQTWNFTKFVGK
jgi:PAS domain S-box-containing protein